MLAKLALIAFVAVAFSGAGLAEAEESVKKSGSDSKSKSVYKLPKVGKPTGRVGGGRRGTGTDVPQAYVLVPDHVGFTASEQPVLYWYISDGGTGEVKFELTLIDESSVDPMIDKRFATPAKAGLQRLNLADHGVKLRPGEEYQWSIALVTDASDRSKDVVSSGWIERVPEPEGLTDKLSAAGPEGAASVYGDAGLWYETVAAACDELSRKPEDAASRDELATLLLAAGLPSEAAQP